MTLIGANKAFESTVKNLEQSITDELNGIDEMIRSAIADGYFSIDIIVKYNSNIETIIGAGYRINDSKLGNGYTEVSWDFRNNSKESAFTNNRSEVTH